MANKTPITVNFAQGLDTKTDPWQIAIGAFLRLKNMIFQTPKRLIKRYGYLLLEGVSPPSNYLTTLNGNLVTVGSTINAYSSSLDTWITKGQLEPCSLIVLSLIKNGVDEVQTDSIVENGMVLTTYTEYTTTNSGVVNKYYFALADATTGQNIIEPTLITPLSGGTISGSSRVFLVGNFFVIVSQVLISGSTYLQYVSLPITNPSNVSAPQNTHVQTYFPVTQNPGWDGIVTNNTLVLAFNSQSGGQSITVTALTQADIAGNASSAIFHSFTNSNYIGAIMSVCCDFTSNPNVVYISFWNNSNQDLYTAAVTLGFGVITVQFAPTVVYSSTAVANIASCAQNGVATILAEVSNSYSYDSTIPTNYIDSNTITSAGSVGSPAITIRSVGLASKAFIINETMYVLSAFQSTFQPSYFLINVSLSTEASPVIVSKLAYENGGGYLSLGLPYVTINGTTAQVSYLFKDLVEALNTLNNPQQTTAGGIYSQLGINMVTFTIGTMTIDTAEIASNLHISGGYLSQFDGYLPVEHNFFVFPDSVEATWNASSAVTPTGTFSSGSNQIVVSSATGIFPGMSISDTTNSGYIPAGTSVLYVSGTTITISNLTTHAGSGDTLNIQGNIAAIPTGGTMGAQNYFYQVVYQWADNNGLPYYSAPSIPVAVTTTGSGTEGTITLNGPYLRLTQKVANPPNVVVYRWSENTQVYNQVTSITGPIINSTTSDSWTFVDTLPDADVVGNSIIYTTGGVVPDCNGPANNGIMTLFNASLVMMDAENPNTAWISKTVVPGTPVEMSQDFTIFISPTQGTVSGLGPVTAIAPMDDKLVFFFNGGMCYINGSPPNALGTTAVGCSLGNYSQPIFITSIVGCTNQQSIVLTDVGLMFQSDKGIWLLGRDLQTRYIGAPVEAYNASVVNSANVIPGFTYVDFTLSTGEHLVYDYYFSKLVGTDQWSTFEGAPAVSSTIYQGKHTILNSFEQILQQTPGVYTDSSNPVLMGFTTGWINAAGIQGYERLYDMFVLAEYLSPMFLECYLAYDYNPSSAHKAVIQPTNFSPAVPSPYGVPTPYGSPGSVIPWRVHAKAQLCDSFQITINESFDPSKGTIAGAGFTMSGMTLRVGIKSATKPTKGSNSAGAY